MPTEDFIAFAQRRLRHHRIAFGPRRPRVTRRFAIEVPQGEARVFERVDSSVQVRCAAGSLWITHDGDCKDVVLAARETYCADREQAMHLFALEPCVLELEFEDEAMED